MGERLLCKQEVAASIPAGSIDIAAKVVCPVVKRFGRAVGSKLRALIEPAGDIGVTRCLSTALLSD